MGFGGGSSQVIRYIPVSGTGSTESAAVTPATAHAIAVDTESARSRMLKESIERNGLTSTFNRKRGATTTSDSSTSDKLGA